MTTQKQRGFLYIVLFLSGFTGLGYDLVWIRMLSLGLGQEIIASLSVTAAFFFGLALGGILTDKAVSKSNSPERWYAAFEVAIGLWGALLFLLPRFNTWMPTVMGAEPSELRVSFSHRSVDTFDFRHGRHLKRPRPDLCAAARNRSFHRSGVQSQYPGSSGRYADFSIHHSAEPGLQKHVAGARRI